jgi:hypothetical protein
LIHSRAATSPTIASLSSVISTTTFPWPDSMTPSKATLPEIYYQSIPCDGDSLACKQVMAETIQDWIQRDRKRNNKKVLAASLGVRDNTLSHWLSKSCGITIPAHKVGPFCLITGSWALLRWMDHRREVS